MSFEAIETLRWCFTAQTGWLWLGPMIIMTLYRFWFSLIFRLRIDLFKCIENIKRIISSSGRRCSVLRYLVYLNLRHMWLEGLLLRKLLSRFCWMWARCFIIPSSNSILWLWISFSAKCRLSMLWNRTWHFDISSTKGGLLRWNTLSMRRRGQWYVSFNISRWMPARIYIYRLICSVSYWWTLSFPWRRHWFIARWPPMLGCWFWNCFLLFSISKYYKFKILLRIT